MRIAKPKDATKKIKTIAICAGSGASIFQQMLLPSTIPDLFFTGEVGHHFAMDAIMNNSFVILTEHSNSERGYLKQVLLPLLLNERIESNTSYEVFVSESDCDPLSVI